MSSNGLIPVEIVNDSSAAGDDAGDGEKDVLRRLQVPFKKMTLGDLLTKARRELPRGNQSLFVDKEVFLRQKVGTVDGHFALERRDDRAHSQGNGIRPGDSILLLPSQDEGFQLARLYEEYDVEATVPTAFEMLSMPLSPHLKYTGVTLLSKPTISVIQIKHEGVKIAFVLPGNDEIKIERNGSKRAIAIPNKLVHVEFDKIVFLDDHKISTFVDQVRKNHVTMSNFASLK
ncbi:expressed unknown protein [Seminavis robusta]|uniref:Uncharacterized protein n=1 Tax=Seminavis robusta TaxID=568900 RepID=A0A9N8E6S7_9STRA|nr:expressed unknown protein [Seminavis robusta]|eukprot:Sro574_g169110.1 n/a (231) ;mRNA; f:9430-10122